MTINVNIKVVAKATLELNESEIAALDALVGYGIEGFLKVFYEHMGKSYLQPHENGLRGLFEKISATCPPALAKVHAARNDLRSALYNEAVRRGKIKEAGS